jgi:hypothetical protein
MRLLFFRGVSVVALCLLPATIQSQTAARARLPADPDVIRTSVRPRFLPGSGQSSPSAGLGCRGASLVASGSDTFSTPDMFRVTNLTGQPLSRIAWDLGADAGAFWDLDGSANFDDALEPVIGATVGMSAADVTWSGAEFVASLHPSVLIATISPPMDPGDSFSFGCDTDFFVSDPCPGGNFGLAPPAGIVAEFPGFGTVGGEFSFVDFLRSEGCAELVVIDFQTEDDFATPLANGQDVASPAEFGSRLSISSSGPNAGAAIFDSSPGGPNDPSQDRDLLVGSGRILILQTGDNTSQTVPGFFDRPNDDEDGGVFAFDFSSPVSLLGIDLVDIDEGSDETSLVVLSDVSGNQRSYLVPPAWTGDVLTGGFGRVRLDLTSSMPQSGFGSSTSVAQSAGFAPSLVIRLEVHLGSSGAVDDLAWTSTGVATIPQE